MLVDVDIGGLHRHIELLRLEEKEARALAEYLSAWLRQASFDGTADVSFLQKHLRTVRRQTENIQRRITLLEQAADRFEHTGQSGHQALADAIAIFMI